MSLRIELPAYTARTQLLGTGRWVEAGMARDSFEMETSQNMATVRWHPVGFPPPPDSEEDMALSFILEAPCLP